MTPSDRLDFQKIFIKENLQTNFFLEPNMFLAAEFIDQFHENGYVVIPDLLTGEELSHFQLIVRNAVRIRKQKDKRSLAEKSSYEQSFTQCMNLWEVFPDVRPLTFHPRVAQAAAALIGADAVRLWHDQALFKQAGGRITDTHQDLPYWPLSETDALTAWIPFDGSSRDSGCMGFIPGSHRIGVRKLVNIFRAGSEDLDEQAKDMRISEPVYVEVPRGSVSFHHGLTAHNAKPNNSDKPREVHTMIFFRDGMTRNEAGQHYCVDRVGIKPGDPVQSDATPIAWPRPDGDLPAGPDPLILTQALKDSGAFPVTGLT